MKKTTAHASKRTQLVKITLREFLDDILNTYSMYMLLLGEQVRTFFLCISVYFLICNYFVYDVQNATYSSHGAPCPTRDLFPWLNTKVKVHISVWPRR